MAIIIPKNELNEYSLPLVCVATGQPGQVTFQKVQFQFIPKWIAIFAVAPLLYLIFFLILRKSASGTLPFSEQGWEEVKAARRNVGFSEAVFPAVPTNSNGATLSPMKRLGPVLLLSSLCHAQERIADGRAQNRRVELVRR